MWLCFFLVDEGYISSEQALQVLRKQISCRKQVGQIAVECETMTMGQVFDVLAEQNQSSLPFGELAIEMGYLNRQQLGEIMLRQLDSMPSLSDLLIDSGVISRGKLDAAIAARRQQRQSAPYVERQMEVPIA